MITIAATKDYKLIAQLGEEIYNLHASLYPGIFKPYNKTALEKVLENFLNDPNCICYVANQNGTNIGYAILLIRESKENAFLHSTRTLFIDQISVLNKYQKSGAGKLLMEQAENFAKENSITKITLDYWTDNVVAAAYFRKKGYNFYRERLYKVVE